MASLLGLGERSGLGCEVEKDFITVFVGNLLENKSIFHLFLSSVCSNRILCTTHILILDTLSAPPASSSTL